MFFEACERLYHTLRDWTEILTRRINCCSCAHSCTWNSSFGMARAYGTYPEIPYHYTLTAGHKCSCHLVNSYPWTGGNLLLEQAWAIRLMLCLNLHVLVGCHLGLTQRIKVVSHGVLVVCLLCRIGATWVEGDVGKKLWFRLVFRFFMVWVPWVSQINVHSLLMN